MNINSPNEDLFDDTRMSFGEHLDELRKVFIRALIGVGLGCVIGFYYANTIVAVLNQPLIDALVTFKQDRAKNRLISQTGFLSPELIPWLEQDKLAPETVFVDPGQLVQLLREVSPDFLAGVNLNPYQFRESHLDSKKTGRLCEYWKDTREQDTNAGRQLKYLWNQLSPDEQAAVEAVSGNAELDSRQMRAIAAVIGRMISELRLFETPEFQPELTDPKSNWFQLLLSKPVKNPLVSVRESLEQEFDVDVNRRLNRALVSQLFASHLPEFRLEMTPIQIWRSLDVQPQSLNPTETFLIWIKAGLIAGLLIASPWVLYQLWSFVAAGLYPHEKKYVHLFLPISLVLFFSGAALAFLFVFQPVLAFLFTFNAQMGIEPQPRINEWLSFVLFLPLGFGIAFQLPLVMLFLNRINVFSIDAYLSKWRIAVMIIFVLSMVLTPADPVSMVLLAVPLTILYFLGVGLCYWFPSPTPPIEPLPTGP